MTNGLGGPRHVTFCEVTNALPATDHSPLAVLPFDLLPAHKFL